MWPYVFILNETCDFFVIRYLLSSNKWTGGTAGTARVLQHDVSKLHIIFILCIIFCYKSSVVWTYRVHRWLSMLPFHKTLVEIEKWAAAGTMATAWPLHLRYQGPASMQWSMAFYQTCEKTKYYNYLTKLKTHNVNQWKLWGRTIETKLCITYLSAR